MKLLSMKYFTICLFVLLIGVLSVEVQAEEAKAQDAKAQDAKAQGDSELASKSDKSGTNPVNFTYDLRFYNEYQWMKDYDGHRNISTVEYRMPLMDGKWQVRVKARATSFSADLNGDGSTDIDQGGLGDTDFRFLTVPIMDAEKKFAFAYGLETFMDTASHDSLGSGTNCLGPQVFFGFFSPFNGFFDLIAPGYQHKFSVHEENGRSDIEQGIIDLFCLKMSKDKQSWMMINPTFILDYENNTELAVVDFEFGTMINKLLNSEDFKGHSVYVRPGIGVGNDRSMEASFEVGYKIIW
jgi:hypothetical protein